MIVDGKVKVNQKIHSGITSQYNYYMLHLNSVQQKDKLTAVDSNGNSINYSYTKLEYASIIKEINESLIENVLLKGKVLNFGRCGNFYITGKRRNLETKPDGTLNTKNLGLNWRACLDLWAQLYPDVEKKITRGCIDRSYTHIPNKPKVYYDDKYEYQLEWKHGAKNTCTGVKYFRLQTNVEFKKKISREGRINDGLHIPYIVYDVKDYGKNTDPKYVRYLNKLN